MVPPHRHQQVGGLSTQRLLWEPVEREIGIETDTDRLFIGRDSILGGVPAFAQSVQSLIKVSAAGHDKVVGQWLLGDYYTVAELSKPIGVIVETGSDYYIIQVAGVWKNNALPGNANDLIYLQGNGAAGVNETDILLGIRTIDGMVMSSGNGLTSEQATAISQINDKIDRDALIDYLVSQGVLEYYDDEGVIKVKVAAQVLEDSLIGNGFFDPDDAGAGTAYGGRITMLSFTDTVSAGTPIFIDDTAAAEYSRSGDIGSFPYDDEKTLEGNRAVFNQSDLIRFVFDRNVELIRSIDVNWESAVSFSLSFDVIADTVMVVYS